MKNSFFLLVATLLATYSVCGDPGYKKFGQIKTTESIVTGVEGGNGVTVTDQYKISTDDFPGMSYAVRSVDNSFAGDEFVKVKEEEVEGGVTAKFMHLYGKPRHSVVVTNFVTELDFVVIHQPTTKVFGSAYWFLEFVEKAAPTNSFTLLYSTVENSGSVTNTIYKGINVAFEPGKSYSGTNGYVTIFNDVGQNTFLAESVKLIKTEE